MQYHKSKDILRAKRGLGHRNISSTLIYAHLVNLESDECTARVEKTLKRVEEMLKAGSSLSLTEMESGSTKT